MVRRWGVRLLTRSPVPPGFPGGSKLAAKSLVDLGNGWEAWTARRGKSSNGCGGLATPVKGWTASSLGSGAKRRRFQPRGHQDLGRAYPTMNSDRRPMGRAHSLEDSAWLQQVE